MEHLIQPYRYTQLMLPVCMSLPLTHAITLTLKPSYQKLEKAEKITTDFQRILNRLAWGRNAFNKGKGLLSFMAVVQGDSYEHMHIHAASGNFSPKLDNRKILNLMQRAATLTDGVWQQRYFSPLRNKEEWMIYCLSEIDGRCDERLLIQHFDEGRTPLSHQQETQFPCAS